MAVTANRVAPLLAFLCAALLVAWSLFVPWWGIARESEGERRWERYGPFERDDRAAAGEFTTETRVLGLLAVGALAGFGLASLGQAIALSRPRGRSMVFLGLLATLVVAAAAAYAFWAFPEEANRERGTRLAFFDRECTTTFVSVCRLSSAGIGWYLALAAAATGLAGAAAGRLGRTDFERELPPVAPAPRVAVVKPRADASSVGVVASSAPTRVAKCPQCQTRVSFRKAGAGPSMAECHNCGLRFPA